MSCNYFFPENVSASFQTTFNMEANRICNVDSSYVIMVHIVSNIHCIHVGYQSTKTDARANDICGKNG